MVTGHSSLAEDAPCIDDLSSCDEKELSAVLTGLLSEYGMLPPGEVSPSGASIDSPYDEPVSLNQSSSGTLFHEQHTEYSQEIAPKYQNAQQVTNSMPIQASRSSEEGQNKPQLICEPKHASQFSRPSDFLNHSNFGSGNVSHSYTHQNHYYGVDFHGLQPSQHQQNSISPSHSGWRHEADYYASQSNYLSVNSRVAQYKSYLPQYYPQTHQLPNNNFSQYGTSGYRAHNTSCPIGNNPHQSSWFRNSDSDFNWENTV